MGSRADSVLNPHVDADGPPLPCWVLMDCARADSKRSFGTLALPRSNENTRSVLAWDDRWSARRGNERSVVAKSDRGSWPGALGVQGDIGAAHAFEKDKGIVRADQAVGISVSTPTFWRVDQS